MIEIPFYLLKPYIQSKIPDLSLARCPNCRFINIYPFEIRCFLDDDNDLVLKYKCPSCKELVDMREMYSSNHKPLFIKNEKSDNTRLLPPVPIFKTSIQRPSPRFATKIVIENGQFSIFHSNANEAESSAKKRKVDR